MILKIRQYLILLSIILSLFFLINNQSSFAQSETPTPTPDPSQAELNKLKDQIKDLENKISDLQGQEKTLSSQIKVMDSQIKLTELKINATEEEIANLTKGIETTNKKISNLEETLNNLTRVLLNRIVATYETGSTQSFGLLLSSKGFADFFSKINYLRIVQNHDKQLILETQQAKNDYANQKQIFEDEKAKVEALKKQLENYTAQLAQEKRNKQSLLDVTRSDERRYQELLAKARAEMSAIEGVVATIQLKDGTPVQEGQIIAVVGNSGYPYCSTGPHLHFEIRRNSNVEDPNNYLRGDVSFSYSYPPEKYDFYGTINPHGSWNWPLDVPVLINQGYGSSHGYAKFYKETNDIHTGIDMGEDLGQIKTPKSGTLYKGTTSCSGIPMNYAAVDHGDGIISWYWHVR